MDRLQTLRGALTVILVLTLSAATGCKKKQAEEQESASVGRGVKFEISYLPQDVFGPAAVPGATLLKPFPIIQLGATLLMLGFASFVDTVKVVKPALSWRLAPRSGHGFDIPMSWMVPTRRCQTFAGEERRKW